MTEKYITNVKKETILEATLRIGAKHEGLNRTCYRCGNVYATHSHVGSFCPEANWFSSIDTFLDWGPEHDQFVTGDKYSEGEF